MSEETATFLCIWIILSFPITYRVNKRMEQLKDETRYETGFQIFLFIRALFEVPRFYLRPIVYLLTKRN